MTDIPPSDRTLPRVELVTSPACHFCEEAHAILAVLAADGHITLHTVAADSPRGAGLISRHRPGMFPLILLDGAFFSAGRLPRRKLAAVLQLDGAVA